jgi:anti-anti-sigma factor
MKLNLRSDEGKVCQLQTEGDIRLSEQPRDPHQLETLLGPDAYRRKILLNLQHTPYIDSSGVSWLITFHKHCLDAGGILVLHSVPPSILAILRLLHMDRYLNIVEDELTAQAMALGEFS